MSKKSGTKASERLYAVVAFIIIGVFLGAFLLASALPQIDETASQEIHESLIPLNGVLFGFTAVMVGLFIRDSIKLTEKTLQRCLIFAMLAFWCFIGSILFSFLLIGLGQQSVVIPTFAPVFITTFGAICSSIYLVLIFVDEFYPSQGE